MIGHPRWLLTANLCQFEFPSDKEIGDIYKAICPTGQIEIERRGLNSVVLDLSDDCDAISRAELQAAIEAACRRKLAA